MTTLKGKLTFISFRHPINLEMVAHELDLRLQFFGVLNNLNNKKSNMRYGMNEISIYADDESEYQLKYENDENGIGAILTKTGKGWGMSNVMGYLSDILQRVNGMRVIVDVDENFISIQHDETEVVNEMKYTHNNSCRIPDDIVKSICKIGEQDCCIFCTVGGNGFSCEKFGGMGDHLLSRHAEGSMRASRIGNCKIVGRVEN